MTTVSKLFICHAARQEINYLAQITTQEYLLLLCEIMIMASGLEDARWNIDGPQMALLAAENWGSTRKVGAIIDLFTLWHLAGSVFLSRI